MKEFLQSDWPRYLYLLGIIQKELYDFNVYKLMSLDIGKPHDTIITINVINPTAKVVFKVPFQLQLVGSGQVPRPSAQGHVHLEDRPQGQWETGRLHFQRLLFRTSFYILKTMGVMHKIVILFKKQKEKENLNLNTAPH